MKPVFWKIPTTQRTPANIQELFDKLAKRLQLITTEFQQVKFATSLAAEDMVLTDAIAALSLPIQLFTLNTGRLHAVTVQMVEQVQTHYGIQIESVIPNEADVSSLVAQYGLNGFYESEVAKKACCGARKVIPLNQALSGADAWLSGQRRGQAVTRSELDFREEDTDRRMMKFNPLFDFSEEDIWAYLTHRNVPIHPLHCEGYPSIGCEPCTRPVKEGEDIRAGRWWWLQGDSKECGLHVQEETNEIENNDESTITK
jgi:phosphoadenosine phosphosulfate reductase